MTSKASTAPGPALELAGVRQSFGDLTVLDGVSFSVERASIVALLGPNGAGKTTTIDLLEGFRRPDAGTVRVLGLDPFSQAEELRSRVGIMLQAGGTYSGIRVGEMIDLVASYSADPQDPDWLLGLVGLSAKKSRPVRRLSGGEQQRLSLALALLNRPELVFLDEPTAGMDAEARLACWELLRALRADGVTVLLTTHLLDEAEALADKVVVLAGGGGRGEGTPPGPTPPERAAVELAAEPPLEPAALAEALELGPEDVEETPEGLLVRARPTPGLVTALAAHAEGRGSLITHLGLPQRSLEDVVLALGRAGAN